jgi:hypothetical protein
MIPELFFGTVSADEVTFAGSNSTMTDIEVGRDKVNLKPIGLWDVETLTFSR